MFARSTSNLPQDIKYEADLEKLGFEVTETGQIVKEGTYNEYFDFYHTNSERGNEVRKEAMHKGVRGEMIERLGKLGVKEVFVSGDKYSTTKPKGPHVTILASELEKLVAKRDVIVLVNDNTQDLGVFAYRKMMREPGIDGGSVVGMVKQLRSCFPPATPFSDTLAQLGWIRNPEYDEMHVPGVIVLNPGELLFSHEENNSMSQAAWLARPKASAIDGSRKVDETHNRVPGHETPEAHVRSVFEHVIPKITDEDVRIYYVGLGDGGAHILKYLDEKTLAHTDEHMTSNQEAIALMQPTHAPEQIKSIALTNVLRTECARSYVASDKPKGKLLVMPYSDTSHITDSTASLELQRAIGFERENEESESPIVFESSMYMADSTEKSGSDASTSVPIHIPGAFDGADATESITGKSCDSQYSQESKISDSYSLPKSPSALEQSVISIPSDAGSLEKSGPLAIKARANTADSKINALTDSVDTLSLDKMQDSTLSDDMKPYPYAKDPVSCPTFSAGIEDVSELIWLEVMDVVMAWFRDISMRADEREARMARVREGKSV